MSDITTGPGITGGGDDPTTLPARQDADKLARMMELAVTQGEQGVAALERLVQMKREQDAIDAQRAHSAALAAFQSEAPTVAKARRGAHGASYAALEDIMDAIRMPLARHGLAVTFDSEETSDGRLHVVCYVHHAQGHSTRAGFTVTREAPSKRMNDTQRDGSALMYGRRYALGLALNLTTGERDDDGQAAAAAEPVTVEQALALEATCEEVGSVLDPEHQARKVGAIKRRLLAWAGVERFEDFPAHRHDAGMALVKGMLEGRS